MTFVPRRPQLRRDLSLGVSLRPQPTAMAIDEIVAEPSLAMVLQISTHAREQATTLADLMSRAIEQDPVSPELQAEISRQQKLLFTNVSHLRGLHRSAYFAARETKTQTSEARQEVDRLHLQLQNLFYEQRHLEGEISACESYEYVECQTLDFLW